MSEWNGDCPAGWELVAIGDVVVPKVEHGAPCTDFTYIDIGSVNNKTKQIESAKGLTAGDKIPSRAQQHVQAGDILVSMTRPNLNAVTKVPNELDGAICSTGFDVLRPIEVEPDWLFLIVKSRQFVEAMTSLVQGALYPAVRPADIRAYSFTLPPLAEQRRIVAKIEALQERSRRAREALSEVGPLLEQFRQSVLAAAFRGALTSNWRAAHPNVEPASELLRRIRAERRRRWEQAELAKYAPKGQKPPRNWQDRYEEPEQVYESDLPELPAGWVWSNVDNLFEVGYGLSESLSQAPTDPFLGSTAILRIPNVTRDGRLDFADLRYYALDQDQLRKLRLLRGDVLFNWRNAPKWIGKSAVFDSDDNFVNASFLLRLRPVAEGYSRFAAAYFNFLRVTGWFLTRVNNAVNQANFNASLTKAIPLPVAPLEEQQQISRVVAEATDGVAELAIEMEGQFEEFDHLNQSILSKAFRGELVPQDPSDEPASALLERIRTQRKQQAEDPKQTSKSHRTSNSGKKPSRLGPQQLTLTEVLKTAD